MANDQNLIWIDLEMTGLMPDEDVIIEIATVVTDYGSEHRGGRTGTCDPPGCRGTGAHG